MSVDFGKYTLAILPEILLLILAITILLVDLLAKGKRAPLGWIAAIGAFATAILVLVSYQPSAQPELVWGGMLRLDGAGFVFRLIFLVGAGLTALFALDYETLGQRGEFFILLLISTLGMCLMAMSADLIMLYLAVETTSIPLYVLAGFLNKDNKSVEAGIKYLLFGAMTSAAMLYGFSLLYGFTGTTSLYKLAEALKASRIANTPVYVALILALAGFGFKVAAVPFHFWAPDVYEGAPTPVAGFLSTASKAAGFAVLLRFLAAVFQPQATVWMGVVALLATASMIVGNLIAISQKNIKRLLAYSSIAQAGYILVGVAADSSFGAAGAVYYLIAYLVTNLAAFGIVTIVGKQLGSDEISAYAGLKHRSPALALALLAALLSLGGVPPFAGFFGKLLVFGAAVQSNMVWLAFMGVINSIIALYYYLNVLKTAYLYRSEGDEQALAISNTWKAALIICVAGILVFGVVFAPWYSWSSNAAMALVK